MKNFLFFLLFVGFFAGIMGCAKDDPVTPTPPPPVPVVKPMVVVNFNFPLGVESSEAACSVWYGQDLIEGRQMSFP